MSFVAETAFDLGPHDHGLCHIVGTMEPPALVWSIDDAVV